MGWMAALAVVAFGAALGLLMTFFVTHDERFDRVAEWSFVLFAALTIPTMAAVASRISDAGLAVAIVTAVGISGVAVLGLGELGSALHAVDFRRIAPLATLGFIGFLVWIGGISVLVVVQGGLPVGLGWLGLVTILLGVTTLLWIAATPGVLAGDREPQRAQMGAFLVPMVGIVAWMVWLGLSL